MIKRGSKNRQQKGTVCLKEIGLHDQIMLTILGSVVNIIGGSLYDHLMNKRIFTFINELQIFWGKRLWARFRFANHFAVIVYFIFYKKRVQRDSGPLTLVQLYKSKLNEYKLQMIHYRTGSSAHMFKITRCDNNLKIYNTVSLHSVPSALAIYTFLPEMSNDMPQPKLFDANKKQKTS